MRRLAGSDSRIFSLALPGTWLMLEAWGDDPPELIQFDAVLRTAQPQSPAVELGGVVHMQGLWYARHRPVHGRAQVGSSATSRA